MLLLELDSPKVDLVDQLRPRLGPRSAVSAVVETWSFGGSTHALFYRVRPEADLLVSLVDILAVARPAVRRAAGPLLVSLLVQEC
jgi:hypothetical protein